jgi:hypothetical protein
MTTTKFEWMNKMVTVLDWYRQVSYHMLYEIWFFIMANSALAAEIALICPLSNHDVKQEPYRTQYLRVIIIIPILVTRCKFF